MKDCLCLCLYMCVCGCLFCFVCFFLSFLACLFEFVRVVSVFVSLLRDKERREREREALLIQE